MVRIAGSLLDCNPWSHMLLCSMSCSHPPASWVSLCLSSSMGHAGFTLALHSRKKTTLPFCWVRMLQWPRNDSATGRGNQSQEEWGDVLGMAQVTANMPSETMWLKLFGAS